RGHHIGVYAWCTRVVREVPRGPPRSGPRLRPPPAPRPRGPSNPRETLRRGRMTIPADAPSIEHRAPRSGDAPLERNPGTALELDWVRDARVNRSAVERRAATLTARRSVKKDWQAAWLLRAVTLIDLTTLAGDDTPGRVRRLCAKAVRPVRDDLLDALGVADVGITAAAVCVYHDMVPTAVEALRGTGMPVAAVSAGFPAGLSPFTTRVEEIHRSVAAGAAEIDIVISR